MIIGLLAGTLLSIFVPYGAGFDEDSHVVRILDIASGNLLPNQKHTGDITYTEFYTMAYKRSYLQEPASDYFSAENYFRRADLYNASSVNTHSTYSPTVFFIEAIIARIAWIYLHLPILPVINLMRFAGLCLYLLFGYFTIRILHIGKWVMAVLMLAPMALYQAATLNGDRFTIWASFFFIAVVIRTYLKQNEILSLRDTWLLVVACVLIGVSKSGTIILLPLLFILVKNKFLKNKYRTLFWSGVAFSIIYSIVWSMLAVLGTKVAATGTTRAYQIQLIFNNIPDFLKIYFIGIVKLIPKYYTDWVAEFGYWMGKVPWPVYALFPISLILAMLSDIRFVGFDKKSRWYTAIVGIFCLAIMASVKFVWAYVPGHLYFGSQGRYFLPFAPAFFIAFAGLFNLPEKWQKAAILSSMSVLLVAIGIYGYGVYRTYYTTCIFAVDANHPCTLPVYRNLDTKNPVNLPLTKRSTFEQTFVPKCEPINAIDLRVLSLDGAITGTVNVSFFNSAGELLQQSQVPLNEIRVGDQNQFSFPTVATKKDETYSFQVSLSEDTTATLGLWGTPDDGYTAGKLLINGSPSESAYDLYLQYECPR